ncbi:hypothetical protein [Flavobacterium adhaerens]|uniref:hypothetical protein n=1 Tax=Flavobacterium adhaerens TaxID=3149043 RepID=UPI0032B43D8E
MSILSLNNFLLGNNYVGIEHFSVNNEDKISLLLVEKKKEGLVIAKKDSVTYTGTIAEKWDSRFPFFLVINTNHVIQKEVPTIDASDEKLLHKAFPNTNWEDFYFEIWRLQTKSVIAITRKSYLNALVANYEKQKITIAGISLGICSMVEIINYTEETALQTNHQSVSKLEDQQLLTVAVKDATIEYNINELQVSNRQLLAFAGILRLVMNTTINTGSVIGYSEIFYDDFNQKTFFAKGLKIAVGALFVLLLVNFIFFNHYYKLAQEAGETLLVNQSSIADVKSIKQRIIIKEEKVKNIIGKTSSQSSLIINEIANKISPSILLTELVFNPLEKKVKLEEPILTHDKTIIISGTTIANDAFTNWIEKIEKLNWIDTVVITHFGKSETNETVFSITINLN